MKKQAKIILLVLILLLGNKAARASFASTDTSKPASHVEINNGQLAINNLHSNQVSYIKVLDASGKLVLYINAENPSTQINLVDLTDDTVWVLIGFKNQQVEIQKLEIRDLH
ncbi:MAG: hypothetical protein KDC92_12015 [Bacteroidetes bacterium]|nr:hypothetical protein [Bacteroidota bacterium]